MRFSDRYWKRIFFISAFFLTISNSINRGQLRFETPLTLESNVTQTAYGYRMDAMPGGGIIVETAMRGVGQVFASDLAPDFQVGRFPFCAVSAKTVYCVDAAGDTNHLISRVTGDSGYPAFNSPSYRLDTANQIDERDEITDIKVQPDGRVLVAQGNIYRLNLDGSIDTTFPTGLPTLRILMLDDGGFLLNGESIRRYTKDGAPDPGFSAATLDNTCRHVAVAPDGKIVIEGDFFHVNGVARARLARLLANGSVDKSFPSVLPAITVPPLVFAGVAVQSDGKILYGVGGAIVRFNTDGSVDASFYVDNNGYGINDFVLDSRQRVVYSTDVTGPRQLAAVPIPPFIPPLTRMSARNRLVAQPGNVSMVIERSSVIDADWSPLLSVPANTAADFIDDDFLGSGNSFFRIRPSE